MFKHKDNEKGVTVPQSNWWLTFHSSVFSESNSGVSFLISEFKSVKEKLLHLCENPKKCYYQTEKNKRLI